MLPSWDNMANVDRALIRINDPKAELIFREVKNGICPNLKNNLCLLFEKPDRPKFCMVFPQEPDNIKDIPSCDYNFNVC